VKPVPNDLAGQNYGLVTDGQAGNRRVGRRPSVVHRGSEGVVLSILNLEVDDLAAAEENFDTARHQDSLVLRTSIAD
jgi:hypothetical protein